jgi:hypothetical protein
MYINKNNQYYKIILKTLALAMPILVLLVTVNYFIDGAFVFNKRSNEIAKILVSGRNAAVKYVPAHWADLQISVINERKRYEKFSPTQILVFGTSRSSEIVAKLFPDNTFFNCVLPGGNFLDYIGLYGLYKKNLMLPKYLIISIDPWTFHERKLVTIKNKNHSIADPASELSVNPDLVEYYNYASTYLGLTVENSSRTEKTENIQKLKELFSPTYFQINSKSILAKVIFETAEETEPSYFVVRNDGGYSLALESDVDSNSVQKKSLEFIEIHKNNFFLSSDTSNIYFQLFQNFLTTLQSDNVTPIIYFSPVNPIVYDALVENSGVALEHAITLYAVRKKIKVIGSFNPHKYGIHYTDKHFMDAYHPVKSVVKDIFIHHRLDLEGIGLKIADSKKNI